MPWSGTSESWEKRVFACGTLIRKQHRVEHLPRIIGLRNRLAHGYDTEVDNLKVWQTVSVSVPRLEETVTALLEDVE
jgi:uncharacterized protein with HEPN domain